MSTENLVMTIFNHISDLNVWTLTRWCSSYSRFKACDHMLNHAHSHIQSLANRIFVYTNLYSRTIINVLVFDFVTVKFSITCDCHGGCHDHKDRLKWMLWCDLWLNMKSHVIENFTVTITNPITAFISINLYDRGNLRGRDSRLCFSDSSFVWRLWPCSSRSSYICSCWI